MVRKSVKVERELRKVVEKVANERDLTLSEAGGLLVEEGVALKKSDQEPRIEGPFGIRRPFSEISFGGEPKVEVSIVLPDGELERVRETFDELGRVRKAFTKRADATNIRQAMRLGASVEFADNISIRGPGGMKRPFLDIELEEDSHIAQAIEQAKDNMGEFGNN